VAEPEKRRSNHFSDDAIDRGGFPDHISRDGKAFYRDDTPTVPVAEGEEPLSRDAHIENLINLFSRRAEELHKVPGAFTNQLAIVAADYMSKHTRAISSPVDPLEFWADLAEVLGHDRREVNPAALVAEVSGRLTAMQASLEEEQRRNQIQADTIMELEAEITSTHRSTVSLIEARAREWIASGAINEGRAARELAKQIGETAGKQGHR
jgi:hypothetical protein